MSKDAEVDFTEYGVRGMQEILEDLAVYCSLNGGGPDPRIEIVIPKAVHDAYSRECFAKTRDPEPEVRSSIKTLHVPGGVVAIHNSDEKKVVDK